MNSQRVFNSIQIITGVAVVAGLGLVIWELQQTRQVARAQLTSDSFAAGLQISTAMFGEKAAAAEAKACSEPDALTDEELLILFNYYLSKFSVNRRLKVIEERSGLYEGDWLRFAEGAFRQIFDTPVGRAWWKQALVEEEYRELGDRILSQLGEPACRAAYDAVRRDAREIFDSSNG